MQGEGGGGAGVEHAGVLLGVAPPHQLFVHHEVVAVGGLEVGLFGSVAALLAARDLGDGGEGDGVLEGGLVGGRVGTGGPGGGRAGGRGRGNDIIYVNTHTQ